MKMPTILHILNELKPSGAEGMLRSAARYWQQSGFKGEILTTGEKTGEFAPELERAGFAIHHVPFQRSVGFLARLFGFLRQQHVDGVHVHCERASFWYLALAYLAGHRRLARSVHGEFYFGGMLRVRRTVQRWIARKWMGVQTVAIGPAVQESEWRTFHNPSVSLLNWFDSNRFHPPSEAERAQARKDFGISPGTFVVVTVGGCCAAKNHEVMLRAVARLDGPVLYLHVGEGESVAEERRLARTLGIEGKVRFLGAIPDIVPVLHAADVFVMPSVREAFGIAAVEAMGVGVPVVLSDSCGLRYLAALAPDVVLAAPKPEAIAAAVSEMQALSEAERRAVGARLSGAVRGECGVEKGALRYTAFYRELLAP